MTYDLLDGVTLSSSASSVTFSSIDQSYRDLIFVVKLIGDTNDVLPQLRFNSDTGSNYSSVYMRGTGSAAQSGTFSGTELRYGTSSPSNTLSSQYIIQVQDYSATDKHKSVLSRANEREGTLQVGAVAGRWASTSAVTQVDFIDTLGVSDFGAGSTFYLYGVAA